MLSVSCEVEKKSNLDVLDKRGWNVVIYAIETQMLTDARNSGTGLTVCPCLTQSMLVFSLHCMAPAHVRTEAENFRIRP